MVKTRWFHDFVKEELPSNVSGRVFCITGTTSGTGYVVAKTAAQLGGEVVLLNRKSSRVSTMLDNLKKEVPNGKFVTVECDLQNFASVKQAIQEIKSKYTAIYCLVNNAGIMATPDQATVDGYDTQMQTNHLSHFLLTAGLFPLLEAQANETGDARVVHHSSKSRYMTKNKCLEEKYLQKNGGNLGGDGGSLYTLSGPAFERYFHTKLAVSVFSHGLNEKLQAKQSKVRTICADAGAADTTIGDEAIRKITSCCLTKYCVPFFVQSAEDGTMGLLKAMMSPDAKSGTHYAPKGYKSLTGRPVEIQLKKYETDPDAVKMMWRNSEEATGITFDP